MRYVFTSYTYKLTINKPILCCVCGSIFDTHGCLCTWRGKTITCWVATIPQGSHKRSWKIVIWTRFTKSFLNIIYVLSVVDQDDQDLMNFMKSTWCLHKILALRIRELNHHQIPHITLRTGRNWCFFAKIAEVQCFLNYAKHSHCCGRKFCTKTTKYPKPIKRNHKRLRHSKYQRITIIIVYIYIYMYIISFVYICVYHCISHISEHVLHYTTFPCKVHIITTKSTTISLPRRRSPRLTIAPLVGTTDKSLRSGAPRLRHLGRSRLVPFRPSRSMKQKVAELFDEMEVEIPHSNIDFNSFRWNSWTWLYEWPLNGHY